MNGTFFSSHLNRVLGTVVLVALVAALVAYAYYTLKQAEYIYTGPTTISSVGEGEATVIPDIGQFTFAVTASGTDAVVAQNESATNINAIISYLKEQGVAEEDIKTDQYTMYPRYRYVERPCMFGQYCPPGEQVTDGYEVSQMVTVKVRDTSAAGTLITGVGARGATNVSGLTFTVDDDSKAKDEARAEAIADAKAQSELLARELGVRVVRMVGFYEEQTPSYPYPMSYDRGGMAMEAAQAAPPDFPVGQNTVTSRVTITYQVQ